MVLQCGNGIGACARLHMSSTLSRVLVDELCEGHLPAACHPLLRRVASSSNGSEVRDCDLACLIGRDGARAAEIDTLRRDAPPSRAVFQLPLLRPVREHAEEKPWHFAVANVVGLGSGLKSVDGIFSEFTLDGHDWSAPGRHERVTRSDYENSIVTLAAQRKQLNLA